jgi:hypothetical protein
MTTGNKQGDSGRGEGEERKVYYLEPGKYMYKVQDVKERTSKKGDPQFLMSLCITDHDGMTEVRGTEFLTFSDAAYWNVEDFLRSIGRHPGDGIGMDLEPGMLQGESGTAIFGIREWTNREGKTRRSNSVDTWVPAPEQKPFDSEPDPWDE